jgi:F420-non-reducing hydrogenase iron-sulfur subunit
MPEFEPKIIAFLCKWCAHECADAVGRAQREYPHQIRAVRVMCSGRVDPQIILMALREGADGVVVMGCHPGECHYKEGNYHARKRFLFLRELLFQLGVEPERLRLEWISAGEQDKFVSVISEIVRKAVHLGPLNLRE